MRVMRAWPLSGRADELAALLERIRAGGSVVLDGAAGVGKSRLAAEALAAVAAEGTPTRRVAGTPAGALIPFSSVAGLLGEAGPGDAVAAVAAALGVDAAVPLVHVDDVHHLDDASATVLHQLLTAGRVQVVATSRTGEPRSAAVLGLVGDDAVTRMAVEPLGEAAVVALVAAALDGPLDGSTGRALAETSTGNVLFLRELVEGSLASGSLEQRAGLWRLTGPLVATSLLDDLVAARVAPLAGPTREALELVALAEPIAVDLLGRVGRLEAVEELEREGLVQVRADGNRLAASLAHPLYGELVRSRMPAITRLRLSRLLADAVDALGAHLGVGDELRAAVWRLDSGQPGDPARTLAAARLAFDAGDTELCGRLAVASFAAGGGTEAAVLGSWCLDESGEAEAGGELLERAAEATDDEREVAFLQVRRAEQRWWHERDQPAAWRHLEGIAQRGQLAARFAAAQSAVFQALMGRPDEAIAVEGLVGDPDPWVDANAALACELAHMQGGRPEQGAALCAEAFVRASSAPDGSTNGDPGVHVAIRTFNLVAGGQLAEADDLARLVYDVALARPGRQARAWGAMLRAEVATARGQLVDAQRWYIEAEVGWADGDLPGPARWCAIGAALATAYQGRRSELQATLERMRAYDGRGFEMFDLRGRIAEGWAAQLAGRTDAGALLVAVAHDATAVGFHQVTVEVAHDLARFGRRDEAAAVVASGIRASGPLTEARLGFIAAAIDGDAAGLEAASERFESFDALLFAAEAAAEAARTHRRAGRAAAADRAAGRSGALAGRCPGAATPPLAERAATAVASARELQVARLAATGLSNRAIAEHLVVSERTVENHLYRVFTKLGVASRDDLADVLPPEAV